MFSNLNLPENFEKELSKNFCAMKNLYDLSEFDKLLVAEEVRALSKSEDIRNYVSKLANKK